MKTPEDFKQDLILSGQQMEQLGIRLLIAYQCIFCGQIFDDPVDMINHNTSMICRQIE